MSKKVKFHEPPPSKKQVKITETTTFYKQTPKWSFLKCDFQHEQWGLRKNAGYLADLLARFKEWERGTWGDILTTTAGRRSHTQSHPIPVNLLNKKAMKRLTELNLDEYDTLYSLTITGRQRVWGIMAEETGTFQLLWYDPDHEIYPLEK